MCPRNQGSVFIQARIVSLPTSFSRVLCTGSPPPGPSCFWLSMTECCQDTDRKSRRRGSSCCIWISDIVHMLCSLAPYPGTPKTAAQTGVSLSLAAFCCRWNTVTPRPPLIFCGSFFNIPFPLLFCSSYSCCHLFLQVLESKFGKGVFPHHLSTSCPLPSSLLCYGFNTTSLLFLGAEGRVQQVWVY